MEKRVQEITECSICTEIFADPRMLPCGHTFCLKCLKETATKDNHGPGQKLPCPVCRQEFEIPEEGVGALQKNFSMLHLSDVMKSTEVVLCEICAIDSNSEPPIATKFCVSCQKNICDRCCQYHERIPDLKLHRLIPVGSEPQKDLVRKFSSQFCSRHSEEKAKMFCTDCAEVICLICFAESHKQHRCSDVENRASEFRKQINDSIEILNGCSQETLRKIDLIAKSKAEFLAKIENAESAIFDRKNKLKYLIEQHAATLLERLNSIKRECLKEKASEKDQLDLCKGMIDSFRSRCEELNSEGSAAEVCRNIRGVVSRTAELKQIQCVNVVRNVFTHNVAFENSKLEDFLVSQNILGKIQASVKIDKLDKGIQSDSIFWIGRLSLSLFSSSDVRGVAKLENKIYVLSADPNSVLVFEDRVPFEFQIEITATEISRPWDIASSERSKCIYVTDRDNLFSSGGNRCVWRMTVDDRRWTKWLTGIADPYTISVSDADHVLILRWNVPTNVLEVYAANGGLVKCVVLPGCVQKPLHCVQKMSGEIIVSHSTEESTRSGTIFRSVITRLDHNGEIVARPGPKISFEELNHPRHLALDPANDRLIVADTYNNRVISIDSNSVEFRAVLLRKKEDGIAEPRRLSFDGPKRQLIVLQPGKKVDIYEVK